jgi:hypothetical protein
MADGSDKIPREMVSAIMTVESAYHHVNLNQPRRTHSTLPSGLEDILGRFFSVTPDTG